MSKSKEAEGKHRRVRKASSALTYLYPPLAPAKILKYMRDQNRPYSASECMTRVHKCSTHTHTHVHIVMYTHTHTHTHTPRMHTHAHSHTLMPSLESSDSYSHSHAVDIFTNLHKEFGKTVRSIFWLYTRLKTSRTHEIIARSRSHLHIIIMVVALHTSLSPSAYRGLLISWQLRQCWSKRRMGNKRSMSLTRWRDCTHTPTYAWTHAHTYTHTQHTHIRVDTRTHIHTHASEHTYAPTYAWMHTHIHSRTRVNTRTSLPLPSLPVTLSCGGRGSAEEDGPGDRRAATKAECH